jgi:DNA adenine methylase
MVESQWPQPFVKWVGGKRALMGELRARVPSTFGGYFEPFVGGGALFFGLSSQIEQATLVDSNLELALTYQVIRKDPEELIARLRREAARHSPDHYYRMRERAPRDPVGTAVRFLYLNKTCFNGLYRVNKSGKFNAPLGRYANPAIVSEENIRACSGALQKATMLHGDFESIRPLVQRGDFVYFDPPYHPTSDDSFTAYTANNFTEKDQVRLRDFAVELGRRGVRVLLSNSRTRLIEDLYRRASFTKHVVCAPRFVNCKPGERGRVEELLITNYKL